MEQMIVSSFGGTFGLLGTDPVGGLIAGTFKPIFFNEGFSPRRRLVIPLRAGGQQIHGVMIGVKPVIRDSSGI